MIKDIIKIDSPQKEKLVYAIVHYQLNCQG